MAIRQRQARKQHRCDYCDAPIKPGEVYHHQSDRAFMEGTVYYSNIRAHLACAAVISHGLDQVAEIGQRRAGSVDSSEYALDMETYWQTGDARKAAVRVS